VVHDTLPATHDNAAAVLLSVPLAIDMETTLARLREVLHARLIKQDPKAKTSSALYQPSSNPQLETLHEALMLWRARKAKPNASNLEIADEAGIPNRTSTTIHIVDMMDARVRQVSYALQRAEQLIERVGQGMFPLQSEPKGQARVKKERPRNLNTHEISQRRRAGILPTDAGRRHAAMLQFAPRLFGRDFATETVVEYIDMVLKLRLLDSAALQMHAAVADKEAFRKAPELEDALHSALLATLAGYADFSVPALNYRHLRSGILDMLISLGNLWEQLRALHAANAERKPKLPL